MVPLVISPLRRSQSDHFIRYDTTNIYSNMCTTERAPNSCAMSMGPVSMAVAMYVGERIIGRLVAGQIMRKGIARKIRRLTGMILDAHIMYEVLYEYLENM